MSCNEFPVIPTGNPVIVHVRRRHQLGIVIGNMEMKLNVGNKQGPVFLYYVLTPGGLTAMPESGVYSTRHVLGEDAWLPIEDRPEGYDSVLIRFAEGALRDV